MIYHDTYTYIYTHIHTYTYIYTHIHTYTYIYIHIHTKDVDYKGGAAFGRPPFVVDKLGMYTYV